MQAEALCQQTPGPGTDADGEEEDALIDRHDAAAPCGRGDVGEDDLAGRDHEGGARARHEARADEGSVARRVRAEKIARRGDEPTRGERRAAAEAVAELAGRQRDQEAREAVDRDGEPDRRLRDAERPRVERDHRDDGAESELVDGDQHAHPDQDAVGICLRRRHGAPASW